MEPPSPTKMISKGLTSASKLILNYPSKEYIYIYIYIYIYELQIKLLILLLHNPFVGGTPKYVSGGGGEVHSNQSTQLILLLNICFWMRAGRRPPTQFACKCSAFELPAADLLVNTVFWGALESICL